MWNWPFLVLFLVLRRNDIFVSTQVNSGHVLVCQSVSLKLSHHSAIFQLVYNFEINSSDCCYLFLKYLDMFLRHLNWNLHWQWKELRGNVNWQIWAASCSHKYLWLSNKLRRIRQSWRNAEVHLAISAGYCLQQFISLFTYANKQHDTFFWIPVIEQ